MQIRPFRIIKTHDYVSAAKKAVWCINVLFTGPANLLFSTPHISITTVPISIKFTYFMPSIYAPYRPNLKKLSSIVIDISVPENCLIFFMFYSSHRFTKANLSHPSYGSISFKLGTPIRHFVAYLSLNLEVFKLNVRELWSWREL